jgi:DNA polymerase III epsilon subunit-like protein
LDKTRPIGAGKSSFELIDSVKFFRELNLKTGSTFLDVACMKLQITEMHTGNNTRGGRDCESIFYLV